jgi:Flp pilus assembly protein TadB
LDENEKREWRKAATTTINKDNPNKLTEIIRRVNQLIEERRKKKLQKQKAASAE